MKIDFAIGFCVCDDFSQEKLINGFFLEESYNNLFYKILHRKNYIFNYGVSITLDR